MAVDEYLALITTEHVGKPRFRDTVALSVSIFDRVRDVLREMPGRFDVTDAGPLGSDTDQLDKLGEWIGRSRFVYIPVEETIQPFTWDDTPETGWDAGAWDEGDVVVVGGAVTRLPNPLFRKMLLGKIAANNWKGDRRGQYEILRAAFGANGSVRIVDNQDMTQTILVNVAALSPLELSLLRLQYIPIKSAGVGVNFVAYFLPPYEATMFRAGVPEDGELIDSTTFRERVIFGASDFLRLASDVPFAGETSFTFEKNGEVFASGTFPAGGTVAAVAMVGESVEFLIGDRLDWRGGTPADGTGADIEASFFGTRVPE
jgi:hypothetical protein